MINSIRFSQKFSGSLTIELLPTPIDSAVREIASLTVPAVDQNDGFFIIDDAYLSAVQTFVASIKKPRPPMYVRIEPDGAMIPAPKHVPDESDADEPGGLKP